MRTFHMMVTGDSVKLDSAVAGVQGSGNVDKLVVYFDHAWDGYAKSAAWWDAHGVQAGEPRLLTADMLVDMAKDPRSYILLVPPAALRSPGRCTLVIDGWKDGALARTVAQEFQVVPAPPSAKGTDIPPSQLQQMQAQVDALLPKMQQVLDSEEERKLYEDLRREEETYRRDWENERKVAEKARADAEKARAQAEAQRQTAETARAQAEARRQTAETARAQAEARRQTAETAWAQAETRRQTAETARAQAEAQRQTAETARAQAEAQRQTASQEAVAAAQAVAQHPPYVGANGNWMAWDRSGGYVDSGVYAIGPQGPQGTEGPQGVQGPPGPQGINGVVVEEIQGTYAFDVNSEGHLILHYTGDAPDFSINEAGHLVWTVE